MCPRKEAELMETSIDRFLTTIPGSLPRSEELWSKLWPEVATQEEIRAAVKAAVRLQVDARIDVISDGEQGKTGFNFYALKRLNGFAEKGRATWAPRDLVEHPAYLERLLSGATPTIPACVGAVSIRDPEAVHRDIANFTAALKGERYEEAFLTAVSPGTLASTFPNRYYASHEEYLFALAEVMAYEYQAITAAGFLLQVDAPDLAMDKQLHYADRGLADFRIHVGQAIEAMNGALTGIPPERVRVHVCHGNYFAPHHRDVAIGDILDLLMGISCGGLSIVAANPQHRETTYQAIEQWVETRGGWPEGKLLLPGCVDPLSAVQEHSETVAAQIIRYARLIGRQHVVASADCGFETIAGLPIVIPLSAVPPRLSVLAAGAELASARVWTTAGVA
jgi:5-methyltetrahydropteroyltriglutamate--homocysteine methyltransferase